MFGTNIFDFLRAVLAEFIASVVFLTAVCTAAYHGNTVSIGFTIGLAIASLAQCIGSVSGGHINPAVTVGMMVARKISPIKGIAYIVAQSLGGVAGSGIAYACVPSVNRADLAVTKVTVGIGAGQGLVLEAVFTFLLVFTVFAVTDDKRLVEPYGTTLAIGISIVVCHFALIPLTGCGINPARSFGPAVVTNSWEDHWIYWLGPVLGGIVAALAYEFIFYVPKSNAQARGEGVTMEQRKDEKV